MCLSLVTGRRARRRSLQRPIMDICTYISGIDDIFFHRMYRMPKAPFFHLAKLLVIYRSSSGGSFHNSSMLTRLSVCLRWLAGGSYLDISKAHCLPVSTTFQFISETLTALNYVLEIKFPVNDSDALERNSLRFSRRGRSPLRACCGALDGLAVTVQHPTIIARDNSASYYNRKGFFALNMQAVCYPWYIFMFVSTVAAGSTHDSTAFAMSGLSKILRNAAGTPLQDYYIVSDEAYVCSESLLTPWAVETSVLRRLL